MKAGWGHGEPMLSMSSWHSSASSIQVSSGGTLKDPCFYPGYKKLVNVSELYGTPCTKTFEKKLPFDQFQIEGTGNYEQCQQSILQLFNKSYCPYSQCAFNGVFLPPLHGNFGVSLWNDEIYWPKCFKLQVVQGVPVKYLNNMNFILTHKNVLIQLNVCYLA